MHSSRALRSSAFEIRLAGQVVQLHDLLPGFTEHDRLGVVVRVPCGALGASLLMLAAITGFYDIHRERSDDYFIYPDYFVFHVGSRWGDHRRLDIWPPHKEVVVEDEAETLWRSINDRAVTRLLVPEGSLRASSLDRATAASAVGRLTSCFTYSPEGRTRGADVALRGNAVTESYVTDTIAGCSRGEPVHAARASIVTAGAPTETYRRTSVADVIAL